MASALSGDDNVDIVGINCGTGPSGAFDALQAILPHTGKPVVVMPNAGMPREISGRVMYLTSPEYFTEYGQRIHRTGGPGRRGVLRDDAGAHPDGGARGEAAARREAARGGETAPAAGVAGLCGPDRAEVPPRGEDVRGEKVTSVELVPPKSSDMTALLDRARKCAEAGVDAINIPDGPRASARVSR